MRKNFILRLVFLTAVAFSLHSCMHDDFSNPKQEQAPTSSFKVFQKDSNGKEPDYARGFAALYWKYQELHPEFKQSVSKNLKESKPVVYFNLASEPLILDDGSRVVIYPVVANSRITGLAAGVLNHEENYVSYRMISESTEGYENMISAFRLRFSMLPKDILMRVGGNGSGCNDISGCGETGGTTQIEPIVIKPRPRTIQWGGSGDGTEPWGNEPEGPPGGGCEGFGDCGGSTGNNPSAPEPPQNPCEKTKGIVNNLKSKPAVDDLKTKSTLGGENGYKFKADGTPSNLIIGDAHSVDLGDKTGYQGGYHNHTPTGIPMFSPPDIDQLLGFARAQPTSNPANVNNAYLGMVAPNGMHYVMWFNGTYQDAVTNFSQEDLDTFGRDYQTRYGIHKPSIGDMSNEAIEKFFFKALKDMGLDGKVNLQRIENDGTIKTITKNTDGTTIVIPCL